MSLQKNIHCFQILSPLDEAEEIPYSIFSKGSLNIKKGVLKKNNFKNRKTRKKIISSGKLKNLEFKKDI